MALTIGGGGGGGETHSNSNVTMTILAPNQFVTLSKQNARMHAQNNMLLCVSKFKAGTVRTRI